MALAINQAFLPNRRGAQWFAEIESQNNKPLITGWSALGVPDVYDWNGSKDVNISTMSLIKHSPQSRLPIRFRLYYAGRTKSHRRIP